MHSKTHTLAVLIAAQPDDYELTARAIEALFADYTDERKADLYALVQEAANRDMQLKDLIPVIDLCLMKNEQHFTRG
jgi:hypothetical protein